MNEYNRILNVWKRNTQPNDWHDDWTWADPAFRHLANTPWAATEKLDGTGMRIGFDRDGMFYVRGRTAKAQVPPRLFEHCMGLEQYVRKGFDEDAHDICLYGEGVGRGIQKNGHLYGEEQRFVIFDIWCAGWWLTRESIADIGEKTGIPVAPVVHGTITLHQAIARWRQEPQQSRFYDGPCEGWVLRPVDGLLNRDGTPIRVKIKERDFRR